MKFPAFFSRWREPGVSYAVARKPGYIKMFSEAGLPFTVIAETPRYALLVNRQP